MDDVPTLDSSKIEEVKSSIARVELNHSVSLNCIYIPTGLTIDKLLAVFRPQDREMSAELRAETLDDRPVERGYWTVLTDVICPDQNRAAQMTAISPENFTMPKVLSVLSCAIMIQNVSKKNLFEPRFYRSRDAYAEDGMYYKIFTRCLETPNVVIGASLLTKTCTPFSKLGVCAEKILP